MTAVGDALSLTAPLKEEQVSRIVTERGVSIAMTRGSSLSRITEIDGLAAKIEAMDIRATPGADLRGLERFVNLQVLSAARLHAPEFTGFPELREYSGNFNSGVGRAPKLEKAHFTGPIPEMDQPLSIAGPLRELFFDSRTLRTSPVLCQPSFLVSARFYGPTFFDASPLAGCSALARLWLEKIKKLTGFDAIASLPRLEDFMLDDVLEIDPVESVKTMPDPHYARVARRHGFAPPLRASLSARGWEIVGGDRLFAQKNSRSQDRA